MLEIRHLKTIKAISQTGSLAKAAQWLHTSSSALSHQLKDIEGRIGNPLFIRKSNPLRLTAEGELMLQLADTVLPALSETERKLKELKHGNKGRLRLAIECHSCFQWLMPAIAEFHRNWPLVELDFNTDFMFDAMPGLETGELDLVITSDQFPSELFHFEPLFQFEMVLVTAPDHPFAERDSIAPSDLATQRLLTYPVAQERLDIFKHFLMPANLKPAAVKTVDQTQVMLQMVTADMGVAALPNWSVREYANQGLISTCRLGNNGLSSQLFAAVKHRDAKQNYMQDFFEISRNVSLSNLDGVSRS